MKKPLIVLISVLLVAALWLLITGLIPVTSVYITDDYTVSEDGSELNFTIGNGSSMGFVRAFRDAGGGVKPHYLKFYGAWGGFNSSLGAKNRFTLHLDPDDTEIYVYHGNGGYDLVLQKDAATGEWQRQPAK